jgi:hypothetical protein
MYVLPNVKAEENEDLTLTLGRVGFLSSSLSLSNSTPLTPLLDLLRFLVLHSPLARSICLALHLLSLATKLRKIKTPKNKSTNHIFTV